MNCLPLSFCSLTLEVECCVGAALAVYIEDSRRALGLIYVRVGDCGPGDPPYRPFYFCRPPAPRLWAPCSWSAPRECAPRGLPACGGAVGERGSLEWTCSNCFSHVIRSSQFFCFSRARVINFTTGGALVSLTVFGPSSFGAWTSWFHLPQGKRKDAWHACRFVKLWSRKRRCLVRPSGHTNAGSGVPQSLGQACMQGGGAPSCIPSRASQGRQDLLRSRQGIREIPLLAGQSLQPSVVKTGATVFLRLGCTLQLREVA